MKNRIFKGAFTALVTPMNADNSVDFEAVKALATWQISEGIAGLVPCGTTGESATMSADERQKVIQAVVEVAQGKVPVIAGAGGNNTRNAIEHQKRARDAGADATLVVTPYYNKPTPEGLYRHYEAIADAVDIPMIAYNVPGRTGCDMLPETYHRLLNIPAIVGIKEATGDITRLSALLRGTRSTSLLSGDDPTSCPFLLLGGTGVISVTSNFLPKPFSEMVSAAMQGNTEKARKIHHELAPLFAGLFIESNPIPVKAALSMTKKIENNLRLPLVPMHKENQLQLKRILENGGWL